MCDFPERAPGSETRVWMRVVRVWMGHGRHSVCVKIFGALANGEGRSVRTRGVSNSAKFNISVDELPMDVESLRGSFVQHTQHTQGKHPSAATRLDHYVSVARTARDRIFDRWTRT